MRNATWPVAAGSLLAGFGVAQATGVGAGWCATRWRSRVGTGRTVALLIVYLVAFIGAHVIADPVGAWPAVLIVASITGLAVWAVADAALARGAGAAA